MTAQMVSLVVSTPLDPQVEAEVVAIRGLKGSEGTLEIEFASRGIVGPMVAQDGIDSLCVAGLSQRRVILLAPPTWFAASN